MAEKIYYSMGEVAEMLDVSPSLVRFWEKSFDIIRPQKNKKGNRLFSPDDVRNLKTIYHLVKERGMTLAGAEKQLRAGTSASERDMEIAERLGVIRALLIEVRDDLGSTHTSSTPDGSIEPSNHNPTIRPANPPAVPSAVSLAAPSADQSGDSPTAPSADPQSGFIEQTLF